MRYLSVVRVLRGIVEEGGCVVVLVARGCDAAAQGGGLGVADMLVGLCEVGRLHGGCADGGSAEGGCAGACRRGRGWRRARAAMTRRWVTKQPMRAGMAAAGSSQPLGAVTVTGAGAGFSPESELRATGASHRGQLECLSAQHPPGHALLAPPSAHRETVDRRPPPSTPQTPDARPQHRGLAQRPSAPSMATVGRRNSLASLAAPVDTALFKSASTSALSVASDGPGDAHDGALDRLRRRPSDDGRSDSSSTRPRRLSGLFKRKKRTKDGSRDGRDRDSRDSREDLAQLDPPAPAPAPQGPADISRNHSDDSLGLHKSVASSLLTDDDDEDPA